jgi:hypothetical protein
MAKDPTTSDQLKLFFQHALQTNEKEWKRVSKSKNADGQDVREFENRKSGERLTVTETAAGQFNAKGRVNGQDVEANIAFPQEFFTAAQKAAVDKTAEAEAAADKIIRIQMGEEEGSEDRDAVYGVKESLVKQAGKALAARYCFAMCGDADEEDGMYAMITPIRYFEARGCCSDQTGPIGDLLPDFADVMESTWECCDESVTSIEEAAKRLQSYGFVWNRDFQDFICKDYTARLETALSGAKSAKPKGPSA